MVCLVMIVIIDQMILKDFIMFEGHSSENYALFGDPVLLLFNDCQFLYLFNLH